MESTSEQRTITAIKEATGASISEVVVAVRCLQEEVREIKTDIEGFKLYVEKSFVESETSFKGYIDMRIL